MENTSTKIISLCLYSASILLLKFSTLGVYGQVISTPCTSSIITTFTPCLNFITGSTSRGSSPTKNCCDSLKSFVSNNMGCACLILTGNVPVSIPFISQNLAISLPQACNDGVPIQCKGANGAPLPPPGPALFAPPPPPKAISPSGEAPSHYSDSPAPEPIPTKASEEVTLAPAQPPDEETLESSPGISPSDDEPTSPSDDEPTSPLSRINPLLNPESASSPSLYVFSPSIFLVIAIVVLKF